MLKANTKLKNRDFYLNKLIAFQDTEPVKVITGIRRCGKSSLMKLMVKHLCDSGISEEQVIEIRLIDGVSCPAQKVCCQQWQV